MTISHYVKTLFSLDTLDTRFTTSQASRQPTYEPLSLDPAKPPVNNGLSTPKATSQPERSSQARWKSPEFAFYALVFLVAIPLMFKSAYEVSSRKITRLNSSVLPTQSDRSCTADHPNYPKFESLLSSGGWIFGRKVDNSDQQYAGFRNNIPYLLILLLVHPCLRKLFERIHPSLQSEHATSKNQKPTDTAAVGSNLEANSRFDGRVSFDLYFAVVYLFALHGSSAFKVLLILYVNFMLATRLKYSYVPTATWTFNIGILFANELCRGYPYAGFARLLQPWSDAAEPRSSSSDWGSYLDSYGGLIPRWEILFNITVLRLISFNLDYYWSSSQSNGNALEVRCSPRTA